MTNETTLYNERIEELMRLIDGHLERGALDEGNATAFDGIIDAWLAEEITRLDHAVTASARSADAVAATAESELEHRRARERAADERWARVTEKNTQHRESVDEATKERHDVRVRAAEERLAWAGTQLKTARAHLLGTSPSTNQVVAPATGFETNDDDSAFVQQPARAA